MFEPGHVSLSNPVAALGIPELSIDLYYEVHPGPTPQSAMVHFRMVGQISGKSFDETFEMTHDTAFNFASEVAKVAVKHGMPPNRSPVMRNHKEYDAMFADLRAKLRAVVQGPLSARDPHAGG